MLWCDDEVLLAYADLIDSLDALRIAWRRSPGRARLEDAAMMVEARMARALQERRVVPADPAVHDAYVGIVALGQLLFGERELRGAEEREPWDERDTWESEGGDTGDGELDGAWRALGNLLDALSPHVSAADDALRRVLLEREPLEQALVRIEARAPG